MENNNLELTGVESVNLFDNTNTTEGESGANSFERDKTLDQLVEQRLREAQKHKEFQDSQGRVGGSRKEQVAVKIISVQHLADLEKDPVNAHKQVTKEKIWPEIDIAEQKAMGVSAGAAFYKVKLREALGSKPYDSADAREVYTRNITEFASVLNVLKTLDEVNRYARKFIKVERHYLGDLSQLKQYFSKGWRLENSVKVEYEGYAPLHTDLKAKMQTIYGIRFINQCNASSDAAYLAYAEAELREPSSKETEQKWIVNYIAGQEKRKANMKEKLSVLMNNEEQLWKEVRETYGKLASKADFEAKKSEYRILIENRYKNHLETLDSNIFKAGNGWSTPAKYQAREEDWSWTEQEKATKKPATESENKEKINTKPPLHFIKRAGGIQISDISVKAIQEQFGFKEVEFGNSVSDKRSKEDVRHFLGAMADLAEMLNLDIKAVNQLGGLSIAFATRGVAGSKAVYFAARKIINLNKNNGDGSTAHEWAHYLDNVISEKDIHRASYTFATHLKVDNKDMRKAFENLMNIIRNGDPYTNETVTVRFRRQTTKKYVAYGDTLEECIAKIQKLYPIYARSAEAKSPSVVNYYGYLAHKFNKDVIEVPMRLSTSKYYHISQKMGSKYWIEPHELFARAFESFILRKLEAEGRTNNYLVSIEKNGDPARPYPFGKEAELIDAEIENVIAVFKRIYGIGDYLPPVSAIRKDEYVELYEENESDQERSHKTDKNHEELPQPVVVNESTLPEQTRSGELDVQNVPASDNQTEELYEGPNYLGLFDTPYKEFMLAKIEQEYNEAPVKDKYYAAHNVANRYRSIIAQTGSEVRGNEELERAYMSYFAEDYKLDALEKVKTEFNEKQAGTSIEGEQSIDQPSTTTVYREEEQVEMDQTRSNAKETTYDKRVAENLRQMGTQRTDWQAVPINGFSETERNGEIIKMPVFDFPKGYGDAPSKYKITGSTLSCELCSKPNISVIYYLQNDSKKWLLKVGSECVKRFGEKSGIELLRDQKLKMAIELDAELLELGKFIYKKWTYIEDRGYGRKARVWRTSYHIEKEFTIYWNKYHDKLKYLNWPSELQAVEGKMWDMPMAEKNLLSWYTRNETSQRELYKEITTLFAEIKVDFPENKEVVVSGLTTHVLTGIVNNSLPAKKQEPNKEMDQVKSNEQRPGPVKVGLQWQEFDRRDNDELYDLLKLHATAANGPISIRYNDKSEKDYLRLQVALFKRQLFGYVDQSKTEEIEYWKAEAVLTPVKLPVKFTHDSFVKAMAEHNLSFLENSEEEIEKFFNANFKKIKISSQIGEFEYKKQPGSILTIKARDNKVKNAFDMLYQVSVKIEAGKVEPYKLSAYHYALREFLRSASTEMAFLGALHIPVSNYQAHHKDLVKRAIEEGKEVPARVLAEYPDLALIAPKKEQEAWEMKFDRWYSLGWRIDDDTYKTYALIRSKLNNKELHKVEYLHGNTSRWWNGKSKEMQMQLLKDIHYALIAEALTQEKLVPTAVLEEYKVRLRGNPNVEKAPTGSTGYAWQYTKKGLREVYLKNSPQWERQRISELHEQNVKVAAEEGRYVPLKVLQEYGLEHLYKEPVAASMSEEQNKHLRQTYTAQPYAMRLLDYLICYAGREYSTEIESYSHLYTLIDQGNLPVLAGEVPSYIRMGVKLHYNAVRYAYERGHQIDASILALYPDLQKPVAELTKKFPHMLTFEEFSKIAQVKPSENGKQQVTWPDDLFGIYLGNGSLQSVHKNVVFDAIKRNLRVPANVLGQYPDLAQIVADNIYFDFKHTQAYPVLPNVVVVDVKELSGKAINFSYAPYDGSVTELKKIATLLWSTLKRNRKDFSATQSQVSATDYQGKKAYHVQMGQYADESSITLESAIDEKREKKLKLARAKAKAAEAKIRLLLLTA
ncbi:hypothetical protein Q0590_24820 [Rhodocytophaga aerolata]|uniref:Large polyvalent protein-associated domain-containing protein n=1 Tax=Rhodocytophaga aerolata TaxID=455078 RepID=A0ABT8RBN5_9BACT|nr:LPD1 domain-containing protein [Rhodocytophaga aerolata]MDO1449523.1 hypothetical protein [Rhodocytophaga aerolata]